MKRIFKIILKTLGILICLPILYGFIGLLLSYISINNSISTSNNKLVYLTTNGVHLDIVIPKKNVSEKLLQDLSLKESDDFLSFGWGDKNFYLNTPEWSDLTFSNATKALFFKSATLIHLTKYQHKRNDWTPVYLNNAQLEKLNTYILNSFYLDKNQQKVLLHGKGYTDIDDFYEATGSYHCFFTCNTWVNQAFIESDLKACLWTPFDFALIDKYTD